MEALTVLITFLLEHGGVFGLLLSFSLAYIGIREYGIFKKKDEQSPKLIMDRILKNTEVANENIILFDPKSSKENIEFIKSKVENIHDWHNVRDSNGNFVWYFKTNYMDNLEKIEESLESIGELLKDLSSLEEKLQKVNDKRVSELKALLDNYNSAIIELTVALEKIKILLKDEA